MGGQKGIALFYKSLATQVSLQVLTTQKNEPIETYLVHTILPNYFSRYIHPRVYFLITSLAKKQGATHLLFEHPYFAWLIVLLRWFTSYKIIVHSHNIESERFKSIGKWWWKILWYYEKMAYRMAHHVWFKTEEDRHYAVGNFNINPNCTQVIPYGVELTQLPSSIEIQNAKAVLQAKYHIDKEERILLFNGTLNYKPNLDALLHILNKINPILKSTVSQKYRIIVCGKNLPATYNELKDYIDDGIIYAGFVEDIDLYFKACDIFLNPLLDGGGIKTKLVEALGFGKVCVSTINGAIGVQSSCTQGRLSIVNDGDWESFAHAVASHLNVEVQNDNSKFYNEFSWENIATKAFHSLQDK